MVFDRFRGELCTEECSKDLSMLVHGRITIEKAYINLEKFLAFIPRVVEERLVGHYPCGSDTCGFSIKSTLCPDKTYQLSMRPKSMLI